MRENRTYGSEGGEAKAFPTPIRGSVYLGAYAPSRAKALIVSRRSHEPGSRLLPHLWGTQPPPD